MKKEATKIEKNNYEPSVAQDVTPETNKKSKTKKIIAIVSSVVIVICLAVGIWFIIEKNANKWELKQNEVTIEYGEVYEPSLEDIVDIQKYSNVTSENTQIFSKFAYTSETGYNPDFLPVGSYDVFVKHNAEYKLFGLVLFSLEDTKKVILNVKDTVSPVFNEDAPTELETYKDCKIENLEEKFKATDKATVSITIDEIDYSKAGEYTVNVYATDANGNVTNKEIKVKVLEPTIELDKTSLNMKVGATDTITATVKGKSQEIDWTSTDESVAKIENGTVTAVKEGTATIEAKVNGIKVSINVTVTKVEQRTTTSPSNSNNKSSSSSSNSGNTSKPSSSSGNSSSSSNGGSSSSSNSAPASNGCASGNHSMGVGNIGRWFNSRSEVQTYVSSVMESWNNKHKNGEITWEEYTKNCPQGYKAWSCSNCGKWTGNFTY